MFVAAQQPFDGEGVLAFLEARAIPGVEVVQDGTYRRSVDGGVMACRVRDDGVEVEDPRHADAAARLFGLHHDPVAMADVLGRDEVLGPRVARRPGLRVPGAVDGFELAVRAVLGQQISVAAARAIAGRITAQIGAPLDAPDDGLTHAFPTPAAFARSPDDALPMPASRRRTLRALGAANPMLNDPEHARQLTTIPGIGPWTAGYVALRLGDPDVFLDGDVAVRKALETVGLSVQNAESWRPWRSYAVLYLWAVLSER